MTALYCHIPFCEHKCVYCDFYSIESLDPLQPFLRALHAEIDMADGAGDACGSVFFGGGTPSLLPPDQIGRIIDHLAGRYAIAPDAEITLEANPGTVDARKLAGYRSAGVNRLSFGVQSFFDDDLKFLTRIHSAEEAREAVRLARSAGFDNVSLDLIFALPGQTPDRWEKNLAEAVALGVDHISAYSLIVEEGTPLHRMVRAKLVSPLPLETEAAMYEQTMAYLGARGFGHYEVSNYAKPGMHSRHNCAYWDHSPYIGFGPSAHSFEDRRRRWNIANLRTYIEKISEGRLPVAGSETLTGAELLDEEILLGLRSGGLDIEKIRTIYGADLPATHRAVIDGLLTERLASFDGRILRLTDKGFLLCDEIGERLAVVSAAA